MRQIGHPPSLCCFLHDSSFRVNTLPGVSIHPQNKTRIAYSAFRVVSFRRIFRTRKPFLWKNPQESARTKTGIRPVCFCENQLQRDLSPGFMNRTFSTEKPDVSVRNLPLPRLSSVTTLLLYPIFKTIASFLSNFFKKFVTNFQLVFRVLLVILTFLKNVHKIL